MVFVPVITLNERSTESEGHIRDYQRTTKKPSYIVIKEGVLLRIIIIIIIPEYKENLIL